MLKQKMDGTTELASQLRDNQEVSETATSPKAPDGIV